MLKKLIALLLVASMLLTAVAMAADTDDTQWMSFLLMCNEGMQNDGGNVGNTMMVVSMAPSVGKIRLMMFTWDTYVVYDGYDLPQLIDQPYRNRGPAETMKVFNKNFNMDTDRYLSLNYLNLANLIDAYGGVDVEVTRAERNALNGMVASKKENIQAQADLGLLGQMALDMMADEYYLNDYGPDTHLNGLQAVGFGWLQYDSVYNCCEREVQVIGDLFRKVGHKVAGEALFYTDADEKPEKGLLDLRREINLDHPTDDDRVWLRRAVAPIFDKSYNNMTEEAIEQISLTLAYTGYLASKEGYDIFDHMDYAIFPLEALEPYQFVAGVPGHVVDYEANGQAMKEFLFAPAE